MTLLLPAIPLFSIPLGLIIVHTAWGIPWILLFMRAYFSTVPLQVNEAAGMDEAGLRLT